MASHPLSEQHPQMASWNGGVTRRCTGCSSSRVQAPCTPVFTEAVDVLPPLH